MKILISSTRYFISGGPERYLFNVKRLLEDKGHKVIPFSIKHSKNNENEYSKYFIDPIGDDTKVYYSEYKKDLKTIIQLLSRSFYSLNAKKAIMKEIDAENPDIIYVLPFINKLSPSIINGAKKKNKKVVVRLSDYFLLCPRFDFLNNNELCNECIKKGIYSAIPKKCVQNSYPTTLIRVLSMYFHKLIRIYDNVDKFICPSAFLANMLAENGFRKDKLIHIPTYIDSSQITPKYEGEYILYLGRLSKEKGVDSLIDAFSQYEKSGKKLLIVGDYNNEEGNKLVKSVNDNKIEGISFLGFTSGIELVNIISNCKFMVLPARWYDNMPNVLLEAYAYGKPVIASNIGCFTELVEEGKTGFLVNVNDPTDLTEKMGMLDKPEVYKTMGINARYKVEKEYNTEMHYSRLMEVFNSIKNTETV